MTDEINKDKYPSNSKTKRTKKVSNNPTTEDIDIPEAKSVKKITTGKITKQKKTLGKKFKESFFGEEIHDIPGYIFFDVLVPAARDLLWDMGTGALEMVLYGKRTGTIGRNIRSNKRSGSGYVNYSSYSRSMSPTEPAGAHKTSYHNRNNHNLDEILFESRADAEDVISCLIDFCEDYGQASVADFYDLVGEASEFTDNKWGWVNVSDARVLRVKGGYFIDLPKPIPLD